MNKSSKFSPEVRERDVRMVQEQRDQYPSLWAAIGSIAAKIGCVPQTLNESPGSSLAGLQEVVWVIFCDFKAAEACR